MIIIDKAADSKLIHKLEHLRSEPVLTRCIYFKLMDKAPIPRIKEKIIESAQKNIFSPGLQIYLCEDEDIFILAPLLNLKDANKFILEIVTYTNIPANQDFVEISEVRLNVNSLLAILEKKIEKRANDAQTIQQKMEIEQAQRKRQMILNNNIPDNKLPNIAQKRNKRNKAEFMIIEDDAFSRRLLENVIQKQYPLTALANADFAIATYATLAPDLLFLDINLPDVTGHELLEKIITIDPEAYVIMLSGNCDQSNIMQAMKLGAKGFIAKPFTRDKIFQYIERCPTIYAKQSESVFTN